ncbi:MAG: hypothetical protein JNM81_15690 [Rhodospirillaceae bacterium]|nr:hypothetical protein [Rhodospirillaceae bacterium]
MIRARSVFAGLALAALAFSTSADAAPGYQQDRKELEQVLQDMIAWLPGAWDSYPQIYYEKTVAMPTGGTHEHWHRTFARINAPQIGDVVFYGQINADGRDGPVVAGSQVLYKVYIDEKLGAVNVLGQGPLNPEEFENLHERPELWGKVQMREPGALNCDWVWRRDGKQVFGVLQGNTPDKQKYGPGTCSFISKRTDAEFKADAEWVLTPDVLWLYDNNWSGGQLFLGREDQTHLKLYRSTPYDCRVKDAEGTRTVKGYDRGYKMKLTAKGGQKLEAMLLRAEYPASVGLDDKMKLMISDAAGKMIAASTADPLAKSIVLKAEGVEAACSKSDTFAPLHKQH